MRKYKKWARHHTCEPYLGEVIESPMPDWEELQQYRGEWVGIKDNHVVAHGTVAEVLEQAPGCTLDYVPEESIGAWYFPAAVA